MSPPMRFASHGFERQRAESASRQHAIAEARREPFDLRFDAIGHVLRGAVGNVAVGPQHMPAVWRARGIKKRGLRNQHEGPLGHSPMRNSILRGGYFFQRSAEMDRDGAAAFGGTPGNSLYKAKSTLNAPCPC